MASRDLSIELSREVDPPAYLVFSFGWYCKKCMSHTALVMGEDWQCVHCLIDRSGKPAIILFGWQLSKSAWGQINANRIP